MRRSTAIAAALPFLVLGACTSSGSSVAPSASGSSATAPASPSTSAGSETVSLTVMEFNVEYGGTGVDFSSVPAAIEAAGADVVGIEEAYANTAKIADALGWQYYDPRLQLVSRLPLIDPPEGKGVYTFVEVAPGRVVAIGNVHLPSAPYGPNLVNDGVSPKKLMEKEEHARVPVITPVAEKLGALADQGIPSFLTGDFNTPSHLDWTDAMVGARSQLKYAFDWPVGEVVEGVGFRDSYREVHPDPTTHPGITWPAARPRSGGYNPGLNPDAPRDRIDFVYAAGPATATDSRIVGEDGGQGEGVDVTIDPWPSDHRAIVSTFDVTPAVPPTLVTTSQRLFEMGEDVPVTFHAPGEDGETLAVVRAGEDASAALAVLPTGSVGTLDGTVTFPSAGWGPGAYEAVLRGAGGEELSRSAFWIQEAGTKTVVETDRPSFAQGDPIGVSWHAAPGNRFDWVGIYKRGAKPHIAYYLLWLYTGATIDGSTVLDQDAHGAWPLKPGEYTVYVLVDDSYRKIAGANFRVTA
jgi:endonuclease/exonuclease/phosphatase family protein